MKDVILVWVIFVAFMLFGCCNNLDRIADQLEKLPHQLQEKKP